MNTNVIAALVVAVIAIAAATTLAALGRVAGADVLTLIGGLAFGGVGAGAVHLGQVGSTPPAPARPAPPAPSGPVRPFAPPAP